MKTVKFKLTPIRLSLIVLTSAFMAWIVYAASAATGSITLTPDRSTVTQGSTFTVTVATTTDTPITIAQAKITYDTSKLAYRGVDYGGSPFNTNSPDASDGSGYIIVSRYKVGDPYPTGNTFVARLTFEPLAAGGSTTITVAPSPDSRLYSMVDSTNILSSVGSTSVALASPTVPTSPPATPTANPAGPTRSNSSTSSSSANPAPTSTPSTTDNNITTDPFAGATNNYVPTEKPLAPGTSRVVASQSIAQRLLALVRRLLPALIVGVVTGGILWFILKKIHERPFGFSGATPNSPGVGSVGSIGPIKRPTPTPTTSSNIVNKPAENKPAAASSDPNDHTPRTFSGV